MISNIKNYFFRKDLEKAKQLDIPSPTNRSNKLLFLVDASRIDVKKYVSEVSKKIKPTGFYCRFLFYNARTGPSSKSSVHLYSSKDLKWTGSFKNIEAHSVLMNPYFMCFFPQKNYRREFDFASDIIKCKFRIGFSENNESYNLDISVDSERDDVNLFLDQVFLISPELFKAHSSRRKPKKKLGVSL